MLEAINITKRYDRNVLDGLSFAVQPGKLLGSSAKAARGNQRCFGF